MRNKFRKYSEDSQLKPRFPHWPNWKCLAYDPFTLPNDYETLTILLATQQFILADLIRQVESQPVSPDTLLLPINLAKLNQN